MNNRKVEIFNIGVEMTPPPGKTFVKEQPRLSFLEIVTNAGPVKVELAEIMEIQFNGDPGQERPLDILKWDGSKVSGPFIKAEYLGEICGRWLVGVQEYSLTKEPELFYAWKKVAKLRFTRRKPPAVAAPPAP